MKSQSNFKFPEGLEKDKISFKLINNLVVIPVEVNGAELTFLLDTGVSSTIMFSLSTIDSLELNNTSLVRLRGLGEGGSIEALKSESNIFKIGKIKDENHTVFVIFDESLNLSSRMGIPIHGIIGYEFFKELVVKTNYTKKKLSYFKPEAYVDHFSKKHKKFPLIFHTKKPYINVLTSLNGTFVESTLLIDSGSSDAIWLFDDFNQFDNPDNKYFDDFLGEGLSGSIFGKRSKLNSLKIGVFELNNVKVAYPDEGAFKNIVLFEERDGSIGGDILKRFTVIYDYPSKKVTLIKNNKFKSPFYYNMSGLSMKHEGVTLVTEKKSRNKIKSDHSNNTSSLKIISDVVYNYYLAPRFVVSEIQKDSPSAIAGVKKGDEMISLNGKAAFKYNLSDINALFTSKAGKKIILTIIRGEKEYRFKFYLREMFE